MYGSEIGLALVSRHQNWLDFMVGIKIDFNWTHGPELTCLRGGRKTLSLGIWIEFNMFFCGGIEIDLMWEWASNGPDLGSGVEISSMFCVRGRIWLGFSVRVEIDLFFVQGIEIWPCAGRNYLDLSVTVDWFGFCVRCGGRNWPGLWMRATYHLVLVSASRLTGLFVWMVDIDLTSLWGIELDIISV